MNEKLTSNTDIEPQCVAAGSAGDRQRADSQSRRTFMGATAGLIGAAVAATLAGAGAAFVLGSEPSHDPADDATWADAGALDDLPDGEPVKRVVTVSTVAGWAAVESPRAVWLVRTGEAVRAWSAVCPHEGCPIGRAPDGSGFLCGCHGSAWTRDGDRSAGPTPRAMDALPAEIAGGRVRVRALRFKLGTPDPEEVG